MSLLCGIDFSPSSSRAARVAALLAARLGTPLHLVHALPAWPRNLQPGEGEGVLTAARRALEAEVNALRALGAEVQAHLELKPPAQALLSVCEERGATLMVLGATGEGEPAGRPVGSTADRLAQQAHVPALVIRSAEPFEAWAKGERPLRVLLGAAMDAASEHAWRWLQGLARVGPLEVTAAHVYWPPEQLQRLGLKGPRSLVEGDPEVDRVLTRELEARFRAGAGLTPRLRLLPSLGRASDALLSLGREEKADLIVVGSHHRSALGALWEGSISRAVLHHASVAVACVSPPSRAAVPSVEPRSALVATDFSPAGNAAVAHAYGHVGRGGTVHLLHVLPSAPRASPMQARDVLEVSHALAGEKAAALERLRALVPVRGLLDEKNAEALVVEGKDAAEAICQAAERLGVDFLCLGTHGRTGVGKLVLGSVAQAVVGKTGRPVLLVRPPKN